MALLAFKRLVEKNCTNANLLTLNTFIINRCLNDMPIAITSKEIHCVVVSEEITLFGCH